MRAVTRYWRNQLGEWVSWEQDMADAGNSMAEDTAESESFKRPLRNRDFGTPMQLNEKLKAVG